VGSESAAGAGGSFAADVIDRISLCLNMDEEAQHCASAKSFFISADMAHAYQPTSRMPMSPTSVMVNAAGNQNQLQPALQHQCGYRCALYDAV